MKPPGGEAAPLPTEPAPITRNTTTTVTQADHIPAQLRRRRAASQRLPALVCGHRDPIDCTTTSATPVEVGTRRAVLALATRHRFQRWEVERLVGDQLTASERLILLGGKA